MTNWTPEGHLTDLALEHLAAGEAEAQELAAINSHLAECPNCRAREAGWGLLIHALESLPDLAPSPSFDDAVLARVRVTAESIPAVTWLPKVARRLRPVAVVAAAVWTGTVVGGGLWLGGKIELPAAAFLARGLSLVKEMAWASVVKAGAFLHLSGLLETWTEVVEAVPGPGVLSAFALMTAVSGLAIWMLHKVVSYEPSTIDAHV
jgi:hypothetical protein